MVNMVNADRIDTPESVRGAAPLPSAWEHLSAEELEADRRAAKPVDPEEHTTR